MQAELVASLVREIEDAFPDFVVAVLDEGLRIRGYLPIVHDSKVVDRYLIEIEVADDPRRALPIVREVGGRLTHHEDFHVERTGNACLFVPDEFWFKHPEGMGIVEFIQGYVTAFFVGQALREDGQAWPNGERAHGANGLMQFYGSLLGATDPASVLSLFQFLLEKKLRSRWYCPCRSGKRLRDCHQAIVVALRERIPRARVIASHETIVHARKKGLIVSH